MRKISLYLILFSLGWGQKLSLLAPGNGVGISANSSATTVSVLLDQSFNNVEADTFSVLGAEGDLVDCNYFDGCSFNDGPGFPGGLNTGAISGFGTTTPENMVDVWNTGGSPNSEPGIIGAHSTGLVRKNAGGSFVMGAPYTGSTQTEIAAIAGLRDDGIDGNYGGRLALFSRTNGEGFFEGATLASNHFFGIDDTTPAYPLDVNGQLRFTGIGFDGSDTIATRAYARSVGGSGMNPMDFTDSMLYRANTHFKNLFMDSAGLGTGPIVWHSSSSPESLYYNSASLRVTNNLSVKGGTIAGSFATADGNITLNAGEIDAQDIELNSGLQGINQVSNQAFLLPSSVDLNNVDEATLGPVFLGTSGAGGNTTNSIVSGAAWGVNNSGMFTAYHSNSLPGACSGCVIAHIGTTLGDSGAFQVTDSGRGYYQTRNPGAKFQRGIWNFDGGVFSINNKGGDSAQFQVIDSGGTQEVNIGNQSTPGTAVEMNTVYFEMYDINLSQLVLFYNANHMEAGTPWEFDSSVSVDGLAGAGTRMVTASSAGKLTTAAIGSDIVQTFSASAKTGVATTFMQQTGTLTTTPINDTLPASAGVAHTLVVQDGSGSANAVGSVNFVAASGTTLHFVSGLTAAIIHGYGNCVWKWDGTNWVLISQL